MPRRSRSLSLAVIVVVLAWFMAAGLIGGPDNISDVATIQWLAAARTNHDGVTAAAIIVTQIGSAPALLSILVLTVALLAHSRRWRDAALLAAIVIGGRIAVEVLKLYINRPRPQFGPYPVEVASLSFPSGHASNSMITFLALALIATSRRFRSSAVVCAIVGAVAVGATRPVLGVHWPSDVIGGWSFGLAWVVGLVELSRGWRTSPTE